MRGPSRPVRVAVLDASVPPGHGKGDIEVVGWWLGARDHLRDPNDGLHWGDHLAEALQKRIPNLTVHPRRDLRSYMAAKDALLKSAYPSLSDAERQNLLASQSPMDYGRSLNVDYVITARIHDAYLNHHRTFHWWTSRVSIEVELWDVARKEKVWTWISIEGEWLRSVYGLLQHMADACAKEAGETGVFENPSAVRAP